MSIYLEEQVGNRLYLKIQLFSEILSWLSIYESIIFLNELYNNFQNHKYKNSIALLYAIIFIFTRLISMFFVNLIAERKRNNNPLKYLHVFGYIIFAAFSHATFVILFCKYQIYHFPFSITLNNAYMFVNLYCMTIICIFIRIFMLFGAERYNELAIYEIYSSFLGFFLLSIMLLIGRTFFFRIDIEKTRYLILNLFMLLYYMILIQNIYMTSNFKEIIFKMLYIISMFIMIVPAIISSLKITNLFSYL